LTSLQSLTPILSLLPSFPSAALTQRLKEKEKFLIEAGELLVEAQKHYETQRNKAEQLMREKAAVIGEYQSIQDQLQAELDKAKFDLRELEVTTETLRIENKQMVQEIAEISGDAAVDRSAVPRQNNIPDRNEISPDAFGATYGTEADSSSKDLGTFTNKSMAMTGDSPPSSFSLISALSLSLSLSLCLFLSIFCFLHSFSPPLLFALHPFVPLFFSPFQILPTHRHCSLSLCLSSREHSA
jgi:hypothetical protein